MNDFDERSQAMGDAPSLRQSNGQCPSWEAILLVLDEDDGAGDARVLAEHLGSCDRCREDTAAMTLGRLSLAITAPVPLTLLKSIENKRAHLGIPGPARELADADLLARAADMGFARVVINEKPPSGLAERMLARRATIRATQHGSARAPEIGSRATGAGSSDTKHPGGWLLAAAAVIGFIQHVFWDDHDHADHGDHSV